MGDMIGALTSRLIRRKFADDIYMTPASLACFHRPSNFDDNMCVFFGFCLLVKII